MTRTCSAAARATLIVVIFGASCQSAGLLSDRERRFRELFPIEVNTQLTLSRESEFGDARMGRSFSLALLNHTHDPIWIGWDHNPRVFRYDGDLNAWIEIPDRVMHIDAGETLAPIGEGLWGTVFGVMPEIDQSDVPVEVRVVIVGNVVSGGSPTREEVGAYIDVEIEPVADPGELTVETVPRGGMRYDSQSTASRDTVAQPGGQPRSSPRWNGLVPPLAVECDMRVAVLRQLTMHWHT